MRAGGDPGRGPGGEGLAGVARGDPGRAATPLAAHRDGSLRTGSAGRAPSRVHSGGGDGGRAACYFFTLSFPFSYTPAAVPPSIR